MVWIKWEVYIFKCKHCTDRVCLAWLNRTSAFSWWEFGCARFCSCDLSRVTVNPNSGRMECSISQLFLVDTDFRHLRGMATSYRFRSGWIIEEENLLSVRVEDSADYTWFSPVQLSARLQVSFVCIYYRNTLHTVPLVRSFSPLLLLVTLPTWHRCMAYIVS